jgi:hypothetical protein
MPDQKQYTTVMSIQGKVDKKLTDAVKALGGHIKKVTTHSKEMGKEAKESFNLFKSGAESATVAAEGLKDVLGELLLPVLGITAAFSSIGGVFKTLDGATDKFRELRDAAANFRATLSSTPFLMKHPGALDAQMENFEKQQATVQAGEGGLFGKHLIEESQFALMSRANLGTKLTTPLLEGIIAATAKTHGGLQNVNAENSKEVAETVANAISKGVARGPLFGFNAAQAKAFKAIHGTPEQIARQRINMILQAKLFANAPAYTAEWVKSNKAAANIMSETVKVGAATSKLGGDWIGVEERVKGLGLETQEVFLNVLDDVIKPMAPFLEMALDAASTGLKDVTDWASTLMRDIPKEWSKFTKTEDFKNLHDAWDEISKDITGIKQFSWGEWMKSQIEIFHDDLRDIKTLIGWIQTAIGGVESATRWAMELAGKWHDQIFRSTPVENAIANNRLTQADEDTRYNQDKQGVYQRYGDESSAVDVPAYKAAMAAVEATHVKNTQAIEAQNTEIIKSTSHLKLLGDQAISLQTDFTKLQGNDLYHLGLAVDLVTAKLLTLSVTGGIGAAFGGIGGGGGGSNQAETEYGPKIDYVDASGHVHGTPDSDSTAGIGHIDGKKYDLKTGVNPVAMKDAFARAHGFTPGSTGADPYHPERTVTWKDTTGASNPNNVDHFTGMSSGGFVRSATLALLHAGETVIPGARGIAKGVGAAAHHFAPTFNLGGLTINGGGGDDLVSTINEELERNFERAMTNAFHEYSRMNLT